MAQLNDLIVNNYTRFLNSAYGNLVGSAASALTASNFVDTAINVSGANTADYAYTATATNKFTYPNTLYTYGDVSWSATIDGSTNVTSAATVNNIYGLSLGNALTYAIDGAIVSSWINTNSGGITGSAKAGYDAMTWLNTNWANINNSSKNGVSASAWIADTHDSATIRRLYSGTFTQKVIDSAWENGSAKYALTAKSATTAASAKSANSATYASNYGTSATSTINGMCNVCDVVYDWFNTNSSEAVSGQYAYNLYKGKYTDNTIYSSLSSCWCRIPEDNTKRQFQETRYHFSEFTDWWQAANPFFDSAISAGVCNHVLCSGQEQGNYIVFNTYQDYEKYVNKTFTFYTPLKNLAAYNKVVAFKNNFSDMKVAAWRFGVTTVPKGYNIAIYFNSTANSTSMANSSFIVQYKYNHCKLMLGKYKNSFDNTQYVLSVTNF
jgi:hypothetical protein